MATDPLEKRSDENLHQMLDKSLAVRTLRRVKNIFRRRERTRRQWLFEIAVAALIVAAIVWLLHLTLVTSSFSPPWIAERIPGGYVTKNALCYASGMVPLHATIEEFAADGYTHVECFCRRCGVTRLRPMSWVPRISMGLTIAQLSERVRCAECGGQLHSVKPWRMEGALGKPLGRSD